MGDTELVCPHCNSQKFKVSTDKNRDEFKKLKGGNYWKPLITEKGDDNWVEDPNEGIAVQCKCGRHFFIYDFKASTPASSTTTMREGQSVAAFCPKCQAAFVGSDLTCPTCSQQY